MSSDPAAAVTIPTVALASGAGMPVIGLGLWKIEPDTVADTVYEAIRLGYRHLDSACDYGNERQVGQGIRRALDEGLCTRDELWITSKLWNTYHAREHVLPAIGRSLDDLGLEYLDLYLVHFPIALRYVPFETRYPPEWVFDPSADPATMELAAIPQAQTWSAMEALVDAGLTRHIGVCNFGTSLLRDLLAGARIAPSVLQIESHPYLTQDKLRRFCAEQDIHVTAFSPLGALSYVELGMAEHGEAVIEQPAVARIAERLGVTAAQVVLRWGVQRGTSIIPKTRRRERLIENAQLFDFELSADDMRDLSALNANRRFNDPGVFGEAAFNTFLPIYE